MSQNGRLLTIPWVAAELGGWVVRFVGVRAIQVRIIPGFRLACLLACLLAGGSVRRVHELVDADGRSWPLAWALRWVAAAGCLAKSPVHIVQVRVLLQVQVLLSYHTILERMWRSSKC
jgi:hypothetical protein